MKSVIKNNWFLFEFVISFEQILYNTVELKYAHQSHGISEIIHNTCLV